MAARKGLEQRRLRRSMAQYKMVKSVESDFLNYVTSRMGEIVTEEMRPVGFRMEPP